MGLSEKLFIGGTIHQKEIDLADGSKETLFFKELPNTAFERYAIWNSSQDEAVAASAPARLLAMGVCEPDGTPAMTDEQAALIKRPVMRKMIRALFEVNGYGKGADAGNV